MTDRGDHIDVEGPTVKADAAIEATLAATGVPQRSRPEAAEMPAPGTAVGRLMILRRVGAGGMGVVYGAYDPELDRTVALKLIATTHNHSEEAVTRLYREAQALAKLTHPNIVTVHDVGTHGSQVWISMEYVAGETLEGWLTSAKRTWREALSVMKQAARGVIAAHRVGLLHRDLKPENIMVGDDGRVRVMDFGLARIGTDERREEARSEANLDALSVNLTAEGAVMGTPAYMAPEQFSGLRADERTDQYSLCATLWEALYGQRAFGGDTFAELSLAVLDGVLTPPPRGSKVPGWLRRTVARGLCVDPARRHSSVAALLTALEADPTRRRGYTAAGVGLALAITAGLGGAHLQRERVIADCERVGLEVDEVWSSEARAELRGSLLATKAAFNETAASSTLAYLDAQAEAWREARTEACLNAGVTREWGASTLERSVWCLDARRMELSALIDELSSDGDAGVQHAVSAAAGLAQVAPCVDVARLVTMPEPPQDWAPIQSVRWTLSRAVAQHAAGRWNEALRTAEEAQAAADALEWPPLSAASSLEMGTIQTDLGEYDEAVTTLEGAYFQAADAGATQIAAVAALKLVFTVGYKQTRHVDGLRWYRHADVQLSSLGEAQTLLRASALEVLGAVRRSSGDFDGAETLYARSLGIREERLGPGHPLVAQSLSNLATVVHDKGDYVRAQELFRRAMEIRQAALGDEHPLVAESLSNLANALRTSGDYSRAVELQRRALEIRERHLGDEHPLVADSLSGLAVAYSQLGEYGEAKALQARATEVYESALGPQHPSVATSASNLGNFLQFTGAPNEAKPLYERALAIRIETLGKDHPSVGNAFTNLADVHVAIEAWADAKSLFEQALEIHERALGDDHVILAYDLTGLARVALAEGRAEEAIDLAARAVSLRERGAAPTAHTQESRIVLAHALWDAPPEQGRDRERALTIAREIRETLTDSKRGQALRAEVEAFLHETDTGVP